MKVKTIRRTWIRPDTRTQKHWMELSNLDRIVSPTFVSVIFFYERLLRGGTVSYGEVLKTLQESLSAVLVDFYPLAGRLALRDDGLVDLHCDDTGVPFFEAVVNEDLGKFQELAPGGGRRCQPVPELSGMDAARLGPGPVYLPDQLTPMPVLVLQLTRFRCESISVAVTWHHTVCDGSSGWHFIKSWSEIATRAPHITLKPVHRRDLLRPREPLDTTQVMQLWQGSYNASATASSTNTAAPGKQEQQFDALNNRQRVGHTVHPVESMTEPMILEAFQINCSNEFEAALLQNLDRKVKVGNLSVDKHTSGADQGLPLYCVSEEKSVPHEIEDKLVATRTLQRKVDDCVKLRKSTVDDESVPWNSAEIEDSEHYAAHFIHACLWKMTTKARVGYSSRNSSCKSTRFSTFVDGRKKLNLPPGYFGNVLCSVCAVCTESEISSKSVAYIVGLIGEAADRISDEYFRSLIDWVEMMGVTTMEPRSDNVHWTGRLAAGNLWFSSRNPLHEVDFGWGKPSLTVRSDPAPRIIDGITVMPGARCMGSSHGRPAHLTAVVNLHADSMRRFEADPLFRILFPTIET